MCIKLIALRINPYTRVALSFKKGCWPLLQVISYKWMKMHLLVRTVQYTAVRTNIRLSQSPVKLDGTYYCECWCMAHLWLWKISPLNFTLSTNHVNAWFPIFTKPQLKKMFFSLVRFKCLTQRSWWNFVCLIGHIKLQMDPSLAILSRKTDPSWATLNCR